MCPSYRVTADADHATGGRVRLLKRALNHETGDRPFADNGLAAAMESCVACKGCNRECENSVDMAMIKIEYLAQRHTLLGVPRRSRLIGRLADHLWRYPWLKHLPALHNHQPIIARLNQRLFAIAATARLPEAASTPFTPPATTQASDREVVLLIDTFCRHFQPEVAYAAIAVLERAGYRVIPTAAAIGTDVLCCGRTHLAHGLVAEAQQHARRMLDLLHPHAAAGRPIIGLEPSCLLTLRDEYLVLGLGQRAERVAAHALLLEEFIAKEEAAKRWQLRFKPLEATIWVHGHCHQKAVGAMKSMRKVLKLIPQVQFEMIEAGCCGMAGSFGIEAEHASLAQQMAEESLLPRLRGLPERALVVANGFSCQQQIRNHGQRQPRHLAQLLLAALA
jgi:glycerol-3-phosphate dehydrogenase subunit C